MATAASYPEDAELLTPEQAAEVLTIPVARLHAWRWNGRGPAFVRIGKSPRYTRGALNKYIRCQAIVPPAPAPSETFYASVSKER